MENREAFVLAAQRSWRCLQLHRLYIKNTCKLQVKASIWKDIFWMWRFFFPVQRACYLDNSRRFVASGAERVSWAVPNKQALSLTVSRVLLLLLLLLLPSHCSPHPSPLLFLPSLLSLHLISGFYLAGLLFSFFPLHPGHLTDSPSLSLYSALFFLTTCSLLTLTSHTLCCICFFCFFFFYNSNCRLLCWCFISGTNVGVLFVNRFG